MQIGDEPDLEHLLDIAMDPGAVHRNPLETHVERDPDQPELGAYTLDLGQPGLPVERLHDPDAGREALGMTAAIFRDPVVHPSCVFQTPGSEIGMAPDDHRLVYALLVHGGQTRLELDAVVILARDPVDRLRRRQRATPLRQVAVVVVGVQDVEVVIVEAGHHPSILPERKEPRSHPARARMGMPSTAPSAC